MIKNKEYDLAILDGGLRGMSGFEICQEVKKVSTLPIILTDRRKDKDIVKGYRNGADDYIIMPFIIDELGERVKARINMHERLLGLKPRSYDIIEKRNIKIDPMSRRVWINNEEIFPRSKEFDLLLFFINNPNRALSREEIYESVWEDVPYGDISTVTVHINKLRQRIGEKTNGDGLINTVRLVGYRLNV